jgi:hypothetical protein
VESALDIVSIIKQQLWLNTEEPSPIIVKTYVEAIELLACYFYFFLREFHNSASSRFLRSSSA